MVLAVFGILAALFLRFPREFRRGRKLRVVVTYTQRWFYTYTTAMEIIKNIIISWNIICLYGIPQPAKQNWENFCWALLMIDLPFSSFTHIWKGNLCWESLLPSGGRSLCYSHLLGLRVGHCRVFSWGLCTKYHGHKVTTQVDGTSRRRSRSFIADRLKKKKKKKLIAPVCCTMLHVLHHRSWRYIYTPPPYRI